MRDYRTSKSTSSDIGSESSVASPGRRTLTGGLPVQRKGAEVEVGSSSDPAEHEADAVADRAVQALHGGGGGVQVQATGDTSVRRAVAPGGDGQATSTAAPGGGGGGFGEHRGRFEGVFGADFSGVKVHTDSHADAQARSIDAVAFTQGSDMHFRSGAFNPGTPDGDRLIAHELTHVVQQGGAQSTGGGAGPARRKLADGISARPSTVLQRKIKVGGKDFTPDDKFLGKFNAAGKEAVTTMVGSATVFEYNDEAALERDATMRQNVVGAMNDAHAGGCRYFGYGEKPYLDPAFWDNKGYLHFTVKSGVKPSAAVKRIFEPRPDKEMSKLECLSMTIACELKAQLDTLGAEAFDKKHPGGKGCVVSTDGGEDVGLEWPTANSLDDLQPGDWIYFRNHPDYLKKHPEGYWQGENSVYMGRKGGDAKGERMFRGFGVAEESESQLKKELAKQFNYPPGPEDLKAGADKSLADKQIKESDVPGVDLTTLIRPSKKTTELP